MNQKQKEYAISRINEIADNKVNDLKLKYTYDEVSLSPKERLIAFKKGLYKINPEIVEISNYLDVVNFITFNGEKKKTIDNKYEIEKNKIRSEQTKVIDEIVLGDNQKAIKLIQSFQNKYDKK